MTQIERSYVPWFQVSGALLGFLLLLPLFAVVAFVGRFVLLAAAIVALLGGLALYAVSPRFRAWLPEVGGADLEYKGLRLAGDVALSQNHVWARCEHDRVIVGSDDFGPTVLGPVSSVDLPELGRRVRRGEPLAQLRRGDRSVVVRAPVDGVVVGHNEALRRHPELVNDEPYADGWIARLSGDGRTPALPRGRQARAFFRAEVDRLVQALTGTGHQVVMADGGQLVGQLYREIDDPAWRRVNADFFAAGSPTATTAPTTPNQTPNRDVEDAR